MKLISLLLAVIALTLTANARAALVSVKVSADMSSGLTLATDLLPVGTTVTSDLVFDIGAGNINTAVIDNVSGSFNWEDAAQGAQTFSATAASIETINSAGWLLLLFTGIGPTIDGITAAGFSIQFNIGINPFSPRGRVAELYDLVLNSSVDRLRVRASRAGGTVSGDLATNVTATISPVPLPEGLILFASALLGLGAVKFTRVRVSTNSAFAGSQDLS